MKKIFLALFFVAAGCEIMSQLFHLEWLHHLSKPLIMVFLGLFYFTSAESGSRSWLVILAILFSFLGDSFLMYESLNELYFMLGLASFLLAHIFYTLTYRQHTSVIHKRGIENIQKIRMAFPVILAGTGLIVVLYPRLGALQIPVLVYAIVLMLMVIAALFRYRKTFSLSFFQVFVGAVLFMISDSILAINKFLEPISGAGLWIMGSYITAQYLIVKGLLNHHLSPTKN